MAIIIKSGASSSVATVNTTGSLWVDLHDDAGNDIAQVEGVELTDDQGFVLNGANNDGVSVPLRADRHGGIGIANAIPIVIDELISTTVNAARWVSTTSTMTIAQTVTGITLNNGANAAVNTYAILSSGRTVTKQVRRPIEYRAKIRCNLQTNTVAEFGICNPGTNVAAIPNGAFFRVDGTTLSLVVSNNSVEDSTGTVTVDISAYGSDYLLYTIVIDDDRVLFRVMDTQNNVVITRQAIKIKTSVTKLFSTFALPVSARIYNKAVAPASAGILVIGEIGAYQLDTGENFGQNLVAAILREDAVINPSTGVQNTTFANSAAPANATLSNTAAGYATLGGLFSFAAVAGAATDYALFTYTTPKDFVCTGITIDAWNTGAAVATTPTLLVWGIGSDGATTNLSTGGHFRQAVGAQSFPVGAAVGANAQRLDMNIEPTLTRAGRVLTIILRMPVGTATASQVIQGLVNVKGYHV